MIDTELKQIEGINILFGKLEELKLIIERCKSILNKHK